MKRPMLYAVLIMISLQGKSFAQEVDSVKINVSDNDWVDRFLLIKPAKRTQTESTFNSDEAYILNRHTVLLPKNEKMVIEMSDLKDYKKLENLDSILTVFRDDIEFYKDSLNGAGNVRIDYKIDEEYPKNIRGKNLRKDTSDGKKNQHETYYNIPASSIKTYKEIRFKKYPPDGDIFIKQTDEISRLKLEQDTVRIILLKKSHRTSTMPEIYDFPVQITFYLNNYTDIDALVRDKEMLHHIIDTLTEVSLSGKRVTVRGSQSTIEYDPYGVNIAPFRFKKVNTILPEGTDIWNLNGHSNQSINIKLDVGVGVIKNTLAPTAEILAEYDGKWKYGQRYTQSVKSYTFYRISAAPYFFFAKDANGNNIVNDNWFVNAEVGRYHERLTETDGKEGSFGIGYLFAAKGGYFQNLTMKAFTKIELNKHVDISPECIFTNNFKQIFPGLSLKVSN